MTFKAKLKQGEDFGRVLVANLPTRVKVDILKALVKQFCNPNRETVYISVYIPNRVTNQKGRGDETR
jgi:hypothetical protein